MFNLNKTGRFACGLTLTAAALLTVVGCGEEKAAPAAVAQAAEVQTPAPAKVSDQSSFEDKASYAVGASVGGYIAQLVKEQAELLGGIKTDLIEQGFKDALAQQSSLTQEQIEETLRALDQKVQEQMAAKAKAEAQQNLDAGSKFLEENAKKEGVVTTASGLQYKILKAGTGKKPTASDTISVKYKGSTIDGQVFDEQKEPVTFPLQNMIAGWVEGLQLMQEGSVFELYIPASLAYGENGAGGLIKPNSVLVFNVELVSVQPGAEPSGGAAAAAAAGADKAE